MDAAQSTSCPIPIPGISTGCLLFLALKFLTRSYSERDPFFRSADTKIFTVASVFLAQWFLKCDLIQQQPKSVAAAGAQLSHPLSFSFSMHLPLQGALIVSLGERKENWKAPNTLWLPYLLSCCISAPGVCPVCLCLGTKTWSGR